MDKMRLRDQVLDHLSLCWPEVYRLLNSLNELIIGFCEIQNIELGDIVLLLVIGYSEYRLGFYE